MGMDSNMILRIYNHIKGHKCWTIEIKLYFYCPATHFYPLPTCSLHSTSGFTTQEPTEVSRGVVSDFRHSTS